MLLEVRIKNLAIIREMTARFDKGLHVITGETGAGKSILLHALSLLSGVRASRNMIRDGADTLYVEGVFSLPPGDFEPLLAPYGVAPGENLILSRTVQSTGNSAARIQGQLVTLSELKSVGERLLDVYGQKDRASLELERQLGLVDSFFTKEQVQLRDAYRMRYEERNKICAFVGRYGKDPSARERELDILRYQIEEIEAFDPFHTDFDALDAEHKRLLHAGELLQMAEQMHGLLAGWSDEHPGAAQLLSSAEGIGRKMEGLDSSFTISESMTEIAEQLNDIQHQLSRATENYAVDPRRLEELDKRIGEWMRLQRKYGQSKEEVIAFYENAVQKADTLREMEEKLQRAERDIDELTEQLEEMAKQLTGYRAAIGRQLDHQIGEVLNHLRMPNAEFETRLIPTELNIDGAEQVVFYIRTNSGQAMRPLHAIASGGELSRIMLAIRSIFSRSFSSGTVVFDEIDTGVSGRAAQSMAEHLYGLSKSMQIIAVTHLPQIAAMGDAHSKIEKDTRQEQTESHLQLLTRTERTDEIARLLSGSKQTKTASQQADQLLSSAEKWKRGGMHE